MNFPLPPRKSQLFESSTQVILLQGFLVQSQIKKSRIQVVFGVRFIGFSSLTMMVGKSVTDVSMKVYKKYKKVCYTVDLWYKRIS